MSRVLVDLDGCVAQFGTGMIPCLLEQGVEVIPDDYYFGVSREQFPEHIRYAIKYQDLFNRVKPHEDALAGLWELSGAGHELVVVSARKWGPDTEAWAYHQTLTWLERVGAPPMEVILTNQGQKKSEVANRLDLTYALEDNLESFLDLAQATCYAEVWLLDRPWNRDVSEKWIDENRVFSWTEFVGYVK